MSSSATQETHLGSTGVDFLEPCRMETESGVFRSPVCVAIKSYIVEDAPDQLIACVTSVADAPNAVGKFVQSEPHIGVT
jgi:hypothetical protein